MAIEHLLKTNGTYKLDVSPAKKTHQVTVEIRDNTGSLATPAAGTATLTARSRSGYGAITDGVMTLSGGNTHQLIFDGILSEIQVVIASLTATYTVDISVLSV